MRITNFGCLLINNTRSKAYIQKMLAHNFQPEYLIYVDLQKDSTPLSDEDDTSIEAAIAKAFAQRKYFLYSNSPNSIMPVENKPAQKYLTFDPDCSVLDSIMDTNIPHECINATSLNAPNVINALSQCSQEYFLFSGGSILRKPILSLHQKFIHIHPGYVPEVRGSMGIEWSILTQGRCAASAFFMSSSIDEGDILARRYFELPELEHNNIASLYSAHIRSELLIDLIEEYVKSGIFSGESQESLQGKTYYKMHPVLNNVVFQSCQLNMESTE